MHVDFRQFERHARVVTVDARNDDPLVVMSIAEDIRPRAIWTDPDSLALHYVVDIKHERDGDHGVEFLTAAQLRKRLKARAA